MAVITAAAVAVPSLCLRPTDVASAAPVSPLLTKYSPPSPRRARSPPPLTARPVPSPVSTLRGAGVAVVTAAAIAALVLPEPCSAASFPMEPSLLGLLEPSNALSLPTWAIHVSSVVEWVTAMALVWEYGEKTEFESWKGLSWGMVPLFGGALCACTWHFFYNSESLEILVALQAALTVIGNFTMCIAAYRIYKLSQKGSGNM